MTKYEFIKRKKSVSPLDNGYSRLDLSETQIIYELNE